MANYLICVDRDGTINIDKGYIGTHPGWREQIELCPNLVKGMKKLLCLKNTRIVVITNQAGVARGHFSVNVMHKVNKEVDKILKKEGIELHGWFSCPYVTPEYAEKKGIDTGNPWVVETDLRKPGIGMIKQAADFFCKSIQDFQTIYFIGDKTSDVKAGLNASGKSIFLTNSIHHAEHAKVKELRKKHPGRVFLAADFLEAAEIVMEDMEKSKNKKAKA